VLRARLAPDAASLERLRGKPVLAFAGIGDPERFFRTLRSSGVDVVRTHAFADHHPFSRAEIARLADEAREAQLTLVTTEKDCARLRGMDLAREIAPFAVALEFDAPEDLRRFVSDRLFAARATRFGTR
jgi:tetraacyldisaccharide 4'-kinase